MEEDQLLNGVVLEIKEGYLVAKHVPINLEYGFCVRPAGAFVKECCRHPNDIKVSDPYDSKKIVSGKSILALITLEAYRGSELNISVEESKNSPARPIINKLVEILQSSEL